jgi:integrase
MVAKLYRVKHPRCPWCVVYRDALQVEASGRAKRVTRWFASREKAGEFLREINRRLEAVGTSGLAFSDHRLRADALAARAALDAAGLRGVSLLEVARERAGRAAGARSGESFAGAVEAFLEEKRGENCAAETVNDLGKRLRRWARLERLATLGDVGPRAVSAARAREGLSARARKNDFAAAREFTRWAFARGRLAVNAAEGLRAPKVDRKRPVAWSPGEAARFMRAAERYRGGRLAGAVAARVFAGLRPGEMAASRVVRDRREWLVRAEGGKLRGRANRVVPLGANARAWLRAFPPGEEGRLPAISAAAWRALRGLADAEGGAPIAWAPDIARHSFISYRLAVLQNEGAVAREAGTSPAVIFSNYAALRTRGEAGRFFAIRPGRNAGRGTRDTGGRRKGEG